VGARYHVAATVVKCAACMGLHVGTTAQSVMFLVTWCVAAAAHDPGMQLPDARFIPYTSERSGGTDDSGKFQYIVEILAVIDYSIFRRSVCLTISTFVSLGSQRGSTCKINLVGINPAITVLRMREKHV